MKTKNNVQKTVLRTAAVIVSFVLISFTVAAQGFWKTILANSSFNQIALAMAETNNQDDFKVADGENFVRVFFLERDVDAKLEIEDWMLESGNFDSEFALQTDTENSLHLEEWMMNEELFLGEESTESPLVLENWMINNKVWNR